MQGLTFDSTSALTLPKNCLCAMLVCASSEGHLWEILDYSQHQHCVVGWYYALLVPRGQTDHISSYCLQFRIPQARHYNPRFVYFLPTFRRPFLCFQGGFFRKLCPYLCMVSIQERVIVQVQQMYISRFGLKPKVKVPVLYAVYTLYISKIFV